MSLVTIARKERKDATTLHDQQKRIIRRQLLKKDFKFAKSDIGKEYYRQHIINTGKTTMVLRYINDRNIIDVLGNGEYYLGEINKHGSCSLPPGDEYDNCYLTTSGKKNYGQNKQIVVCIKYILEKLSYPF